MNVTCHVDGGVTLAGCPAATAVERSHDGVEWYQIGISAADGTYTDLRPDRLWSWVTAASAMRTGGWADVSGGGRPSGSYQSVQPGATISWTFTGRRCSVQGSMWWLAYTGTNGLRFRTSALVVVDGVALPKLDLTGLGAGAVGEQQGITLWGHEFADDGPHTVTFTVENVQAGTAVCVYGLYTDTAKTAMGRTVHYRCGAQTATCVPRIDVSGCIDRWGEALLDRQDDFGTTPAVEDSADIVPAYENPTVGVSAYPMWGAVVFASLHRMTGDARYYRAMERQFGYALTRTDASGHVVTWDGSGATHPDYDGRQCYMAYHLYKQYGEARFITEADRAAGALLTWTRGTTVGIDGNSYSPTIAHYGSTFYASNMSISWASALAQLFMEPDSAYYNNTLVKSIIDAEIGAHLTCVDVDLKLRETTMATNQKADGGYAAFSLSSHAAILACGYAYPNHLTLIQGAMAMAVSQNIDGWHNETTRYPTAPWVANFFWRLACARVLYDGGAMAEADYRSALSKSVYLACSAYGQPAWDGVDTGPLNVYGNVFPDSTGTWHEIGGDNYSLSVALAVGVPTSDVLNALHAYDFDVLLLADPVAEFDFDVLLLADPVAEFDFDVLLLADPVAEFDFDVLLSYTQTLMTYSSPSRQVIGSLDIYFDGIGNPPVHIDNSDYLIDMEVTEELGADGANPLGSISANELTFTLANFNNLFSPANVASAYYGKIKLDVPVKAYLTLGQSGATPVLMGTFYVSEWDARLGDAVASVTCVDAMQALLRMPIPNLDMQVATTYSAFLDYILTGYGLAATVDSTLTSVLPYGAFSIDTTRELLRDVTTAAMASLVVDRSGQFVAKRFIASTPVATLTDDNQLISINVLQSIARTYDGVGIKYYLPQPSDDMYVLIVENLAIPGGTATHNPIRYIDPVFNITAVTLDGKLDAHLDSYSSTNLGIAITTTSSVAGRVRLTVTGKSIVFVAQELLDTVGKILSVDNQYIQSTEYAASYKALLDNYVSIENPTLDLTIRGNPEIVVGDTVVVQSNRYAIDYTGIVKRAVYRYDGGLSCNMTLLNAGVYA